MKKYTKAILMSAFVFPGAGHILLKRYISSIILIASALSATVIIFNFVIKQALVITDKILMGEIEANIFVIRAHISEQQALHGSLLLDIATYSLLATWVISMIDCYRISKQN